MHESEQDPKDEVKPDEPTDSKDERPIAGRREELLSMLLDTIKASENLPSHVRFSFVTYVDLESSLALLYAILRAPQG